MDYKIGTLDQLKLVLKGFRQQRGLTQAAIAAQLGVTQQTYAQLELNPAVASVERLFRVLRLLGINLLLTESGQTTAQTGSPAKAAPHKRPATRGPTKPVSKTATRKTANSTATRKTAVAKLSTPAAIVKKRESW